MNEMSDILRASSLLVVLLNFLRVSWKESKDIEWINFFIGRCLTLSRVER